MNLALRLLIPCAVLLGLAACGGYQPVPPATSVPLIMTVTLEPLIFTETGAGPDYTIETGTPTLAGSTDPRIAAFNDAMNALVQENVDSFKENLENLPVTPIAQGSSLRIGYLQVAPPGNLLSIKFIISYYSDGAAHPGSYTRTATYDLEAGRFLTLDELFLPGSDYLGTISAYCIAQLKASPIGEVFYTEGAQPTADNYRNWNVTGEGLLITFDEYQVAAYAAGQQTIIVPYAELSAILDPQGPLAAYIH